MIRSSALRRFAALLLLIGAAFAVNGAPFAFHHASATAQEQPKAKTPPQHRPGPPPGVGGTSLTLSDVWGPAEMPPAPKDFGPHFDFPPEPLSGGLSHDPYPN